MNPQGKSPSVQPSVAAIMIAPKQKTAEPNDTAEPETSVRKVSILWTSYHHIHHFTGHAMQSRHIGGCCIHGCKHQPECQGFSDSFKTSSREIHEKSQTYPTKKHDDQRAALHNLSQIRQRIRLTNKSHFWTPEAMPDTHTWSIRTQCFSKTLLQDMCFLRKKEPFELQKAASKNPSL